MSKWRQKRCAVWRAKPSRAGWQRHHILPLSLLNYSFMGKFLQDIETSGVRLDCFVSNSMLLPGLDEAALATGLPLHRGPHHRYDSFCATLIDRVYVESRRTAAPTAAVAANVVAIQRGLHAALSQPHIGNPIVLSDRTCPIEDVFFAALDQQTDLLFDRWHRRADI